MPPRKFIIVTLFTLFVFCGKSTGQAEDLKGEVEKLRATVETLRKLKSKINGLLP
jgi:hypothetical protein